MKIFCIGRNYADHAKEMNSLVPTEPMIFMKPATALLRNNDPFYIPEFSDNIHYEGEIVLRVCKNGKYVQPQFAHLYYDHVAFGIDFTARDIQAKLKEKGHPWEIAKAFDKSAAISKFVSLEGKDKKTIKIETKLNGSMVQESSSAQMIFDFDTLICHVSKYFTIQQGDYIYTGTPAGVGQVQIGDIIEGYIDREELLRCEVR